MNQLGKIGPIQSMYNESFQFLQIRKKRQAQQLRLLVNLQKGEQTIGSTLLLTLFNRLLSSVYDDKMQVKFMPSQGIMQEQIDAYNTLAKSDYIEMEKAKLDYDWCWDTLFYGRGYVETSKFNKKRKIMEPVCINPLVMGYDPLVSEVQSWRYYWKWVTKTKWELEKLIDAGIITGIKKPEEIRSGMEDFLFQYKTTVDMARKGIEPPPDPHSGDIYQILEFYYHNPDDGEREVCWLDKNFSKILMEEKLDFEDAEDGTSQWPIVMKEAYRQPHSTLPFSVADLLDDKHRAKAVLLNLALIAAKDQANPIYLYNKEKVDDVTQFMSRQVNQHIPVSEMEGAVEPLQKAPAMTADLQAFMQYLDAEAEAPMGAGKPMSEPGGSTSQTATQASLDQQLNDMSQSLISKVMQNGEKEFWSHWFHRYAKNGPALKEKMANIVGVKGVDSQVIDLSLFSTDFPPGIMVYSAKEAEYKELVLRRDLMQLYPVLAQTLDPEGLRNFNKHVFFPKFLNDPSLIDVMLPKTIDEMKAEQENEQLKKEQMIQALPTDEHTTHIYTHNMIPPGQRTWAMWFHLAEHEALLAEQKAMEQQMMQMEMQSSSQGPRKELGGKGRVGPEKQSPKSQASPLATELKNT